MKKEVFEIGLNFHLALIRAKPKQATRDNAKKHLVDGDERLTGLDSQTRSKAHSLARKIQGRIDDLTKYHGAEWPVKCDLYKSNNSRTPKQEVFDAVRHVMTTNEKIGTTASSFGVNFMCVEKLLERMERWDSFSGKLNNAVIP